MYIVCIVYICVYDVYSVYTYVDQTIHTIHMVYTSWFEALQCSKLATIHVIHVYTHNYTYIHVITRITHNRVHCTKMLPALHRQHSALQSLPTTHGSQCLGSIVHNVYIRTTPISNPLHLPRCQSAACRAILYFEQMRFAIRTNQQIRHAFTNGMQCDDRCTDSTQCINNFCLISINPFCFKHRCNSTSVVSAKYAARAVRVVHHPAAFAMSLGKRPHCVLLVSSAVDA